MLKKGCGCNKSTNVTPELPKDWGIPKIDLNPIKPDCNQLRKPWDCPDILPAVLINNNPDNEDITSVIEGNLEVLKFADKAYNPMTYSGMGRVFLRKNLIDDDTTLSCPSKVNKLELWMFNDKDGQPLTNTIFIIQYDYDLKGGFITIPCNSILLFLGGSFNNGTVVLTDTLVLPHMLEYSKYMNCAIKGSFAKGQTFYSDGVIKVWNGVSWVEFAGSTEFTELLNELKDELNGKINKNTTDILSISDSLNNYALKVHLHVLSDITGLLEALNNKINNGDNLITINGRTLKKGDSITIQGDTPLGGVSLNDVLTEIRKLNLNHTSNNIQLKYGNDLLNEVNDNTGNGGGGGDSSDDGLPGNILIYFLKTNSSTVPSTPADGQILNLKILYGGNELTWQDSAPNHEDGKYIWMSQIYQTYTGNNYGNWSYPILIDDGSNNNSAGSDTANIEFIFARANIENWSTAGIGNPADYPANQSDDYIPVELRNKWSDTPQGISQDMRYEFISYRTKSTELGWSTFTSPALWSAYGRDGTDGAGVEYIFFKGRVAPDNNSDIQNPHRWYEDADSKADVNKTSFNKDEFILSGSGWTDDPESLEAGESVWVSIRKYRNDTDTASAETADAYWHQYSEPALWSHYGEDAISAGVLDFDNETMTVPVNSETGKNYLFADTAYAYIFYEEGSIPISNLIYDGLYNGDLEITNSYVRVSIDSNIKNKVIVSIDAEGLDFNQIKNYALRFTAQSTNLADRTGTVKLIGVQSGKDGESYTLSLNTTVIKKGVGTQTGGFIPESITPKLFINGGDNAGTYTPTEIGTNQKLRERFEIKCGIDGGELLTSPDSIASNRINDYIVVALLYDGNIIDQETIFVIEDGHAGIPATVYNIIPQSSDVINTESNVTGQLTFKVSRKYGDQEVLYLQGGKFVKTEESGVTESAKVNVSLDGTQSITTGISEVLGVYTVDIDSSGNYNVIVITLLVGESETEVTSIVVPITQAGSEGSQTLLQGIMRYRNIDNYSTSTTFYDGRTPDPDAQNGYFQDFVRWRDTAPNDKWGTYMCIDTTTIAPSNIPTTGVTSRKFIKLDYTFAEVVSYLIADRAWIDNLSVRQVVVFDGAQTPNVVAGMTSGSTLPTEITNKNHTNNDGIRIWAGLIEPNGDLNTAPFTVDSSGKLKAKNAEIVGKVQATEFQTGDNEEHGIVVIKSFGSDDNETNFFRDSANQEKAYMYSDGRSMTIAIYDKIDSEWKKLNLANMTSLGEHLPYYERLYQISKNANTKVVEVSEFYAGKDSDGAYYLGTTINSKKLNNGKYYRRIKIDNSEAPIRLITKINTLYGVVNRDSGAPGFYIYDPVLVDDNGKEMTSVMGGRVIIGPTIVYEDETIYYSPNLIDYITGSTKETINLEDFFSNSKNLYLTTGEYELSFTNFNNYTSIGTAPDTPSSHDFYFITPNIDSGTISNDWTVATKMNIGLNTDTGYYQYTFNNITNPKRQLKP